MPAGPAATGPCPSPAASSGAFNAAASTHRSRPHANLPGRFQTVENWADEAEQGYELDGLRKRGRKPVGDGPGQVIPVRLDKTLLAAVATVIA